MNECKICVMNETDPSFSLDEHGVCNHCRTYSEKIKFSEREYKQFKDFVRKSNSHLDPVKYDCIIGLSGGLDSTYLAIHVVKDLGLNPLAIHMDNGWNSGLAATNIKNIVEVLNIDLITEVLDWDEFRKMQVAIFKCGVADLEAPTDFFISSTLRKYAKKYKIKTVLSGSNPQTEGIMSNDWSYGQRDPIYINDIYQVTHGDKIKKLPIVNIYKSIYHQLFKTYTVHRPLKFMDYTRAKAVERSKKEVNWQEYPRKHGESFITRYYQDIFLPTRFGVDKRLAHYSALILNGEISRAEAIEKIRTPVSPKSIEADISYLCLKLNFSRDEYESLMQADIRSYKNFETIHKNWLYRFSRVLIKENGVFSSFYSYLGDLLRR